MSMPALRRKHLYILGRERLRDYNSTVSESYSTKQDATLACEEFKVLIDRINEMKLLSFQERWEKHRNKITKVEPCVRTIKINGEPMSLAFPYMYFLDVSHVLWSMEDVEKISENKAGDIKLFLPFLPNIFGNGSICWGARIPGKKDVVPTFFGGGFDTGEGVGHAYLPYTKLRNFETWQKKTKECSPLEVFDDVDPPKNVCMLMRDLL